MLHGVLSLPTAGKARLPGRPRSSRPPLDCCGPERPDRMSCRGPANARPGRTPRSAHPRHARSGHRAQAHPGRPGPKRRASPDCPPMTDRADLMNHRPSWIFRAARPPHVGPISSCSDSAGLPGRHVKRMRSNYARPGRAGGNRECTCQAAHTYARGQRPHFGMSGRPLPAAIALFCAEVIISVGASPRRQNGSARVIRRNNDHTSGPLPPLAGSAPRRNQAAVDSVLERPAVPHTAYRSG